MALAVVVATVPGHVEAQRRSVGDVVYGHRDGMAMVYDVALPDGDADQVLPMEENSSRLHRILSDEGVRNELVTVEAGHALFTGEAKATADRAVVEWFRRSLLEQ